MINLILLDLLRAVDWAWFATPYFSFQFFSAGEKDPTGRSTLGTSPQDTSTRFKEKVLTIVDTCPNLLGVEVWEVDGMTWDQGWRGETSANKPQQQKYYIILLVCKAGQGIKSHTCKMLRGSLRYMAAGSSAASLSKFYLEEEAAYRAYMP